MHGFWRIEGVVGWPGGTRGNGGRADGCDHKVAAPPGKVMPVMATVQVMPKSASTCFSQPRSLNRKPTVSLGAKFKNL